MLRQLRPLEVADCLGPLDPQGHHSGGESGQEHGEQDGDRRREARDRRVAPGPSPEPLATTDGAGGDRRAIQEAPQVVR